MRIVRLLVIIFIGCNSVHNDLEKLCQKISSEEKDFLLSLAEDTNTIFSYEFEKVYAIKNISTIQYYKIKKIINKYDIEELNINKSKIMIDPKYFQQNQNEYRIIILSNESKEKILNDEKCIDIIKVEKNTYIGIYPESI